MDRQSDRDIKKLFEALKILMFWPHPSEFDSYTPHFYLRSKKIPFEYKSLREQELHDIAMNLYRFITRFPLSVYIETTNTCNLNCIMCPHKTLKRKKGQMTKQLFYKIIDEIAEKQPSISVSPFFFGEPLMDKNIFDRIIYCKNKGLTFIKLSTNGSLLSWNENYKKLIDSGLDHLLISFDGITSETYESIRIGSKFKNFIKGIELLIDYKAKSGSNTKIVAQMIIMENNLHEEQKLSDFLEEFGIKPYFTPLYFWGKDQPDLLPLKALQYPCNNPLYSAVILNNGDLVACCMDYEGESVFGNLSSKSLEEIWQKEHSLLTKAQLKGQYDLYPVCQKCYDWMNFGYNKFADLINMKK